MKAAPLLICVLVLGSSKDRSFFVTSAPTQTPPTNGNLEIVPDNKDPDVSQLESLKLPSDKSVSVSKSQSATYSDVNGHKQAFVSQQTDVDVDGKLVGRLKQSSNNGGRIRTSIELPQHEPTPEQLAAAQNSIDKVLYTNGVQYSPLDMAEYVFWTGDEKGVTLAIEDFLEDGMMTQDEALTFLQEIKLNLDYLQEHYSQQGFRSNDLQKEDLGSKLKLNVHQNDPVESFRNIIDEFNQDNQYDSMNILKNDINKKDSINRASIGQTPQRGPKQPEHVINDEEYETLLERLRVADFLYTQYSLEEVIYQLAKVMFSQSLTRGSTEAQEALQKFTTFLESETEQGHISRSLEKKVLDVLIAALTDVLTEHPELVSAARKGLGGDGALQLPPDNNILQHILEYTPNEKQDTAKPSYSLFKTQGHQNNFYQQNKEILERIKSKQVENREFKH